MNSLIKALVIACVATAPIAALAQSEQPLTRDQVRAELVQIEKSGYTPNADWIRYPENVEAADIRAAAQNDSEHAHAAGSGYGSSMNGSSQLGATIRPSPQSDYYFGR